MLTHSRFLCPEGCGRLSTRSPVDGRHHCLKCGYSADIESAAGSTTVEEIAEAGALDLAGDIDAEEVLANVLRVANAVPNKIRESWMLNAQEKLVGMCEEVEAVTGVPAHPALRLNILSLILGWE